MRYDLIHLLRASASAITTTGRFGLAATVRAALFAIFVVTMAAGCSSQPPAAAPASRSGMFPLSSPPAPTAAGAPQVITSLSQLSSGNTDTESLNTAAKVLKSHPSRNQAEMVAHGMGHDTPSTLRRLFLENPDSPRYAETMIPHTQIRLLNAKAAENPGFSNLMLTQLLSEMVKQEKLPPMVKLALSEEVKPVILTAVLDDKGQLKELIYHQHSGLAAIDNFVIATCKESLWANNMPKAALSGNGTYRLRIEAQVSKYSADRGGNQTFSTRVGLGIL
jgi:hypothetical protein